MASSRKPYRMVRYSAPFSAFMSKALMMLMLAGAMIATPQVALAEDFVPDVPDTPMSIQMVELSALGDNGRALPGETLEVAQLVPMQLRVTCDPASASMGIDCGMPEMCGIDPCLCGSADSWGGCSCNGYQECFPEFTCVAVDPGVVAVETTDDGVFLRSMGKGTTTVQVRATMPHHTDATAEFMVSSGAFRIADFAFIGIIVLVVAVLGGIAAAIIFAVRRRDTMKHVPLLASALLLVLCMGALAGCAGPQISETSPRIQEVAFNPSSDMTEGSQKAEIRLVFDQQVEISGNVLDDFELLLNGSPVDGSTVAVNAHPNATGVAITLTPAAGTMGVGKGSYFALYQADVDLRAKRDDGMLTSVTGIDGSAAVMAEPVKGTFPSGLALEEVEVIPGDVGADRIAQTTFRVTSPAIIRAVTWFSPDGGQTKLLKHNHTFMDASAQDCAADLAKVINAAPNLSVSASAIGDTVVMRASSVVDGQELHPMLIEGIGAEGGAFEALSE